MSIQTIQNESHLGILVVQEMPEELHEKLSDAQIYSGLWDSMMKLEDLLYNAFFYCGDFKGKYCVGVFLPFTHFEHNLEKNIEVSNSILYECIQKMLERLSSSIFRVTNNLGVSKKYLGVNLGD